MFGAGGLPGGSGQPQGGLVMSQPPQHSTEAPRGVGRWVGGDRREVTGGCWHAPQHMSFVCQAGPWTKAQVMTCFVLSTTCKIPSEGCPSNPTYAS